MIKKKLTKLLFLTLLLSSHLAFASDWKLGGYAKDEKNIDEVLFYDAETITKRNGNVRFWIKSIDRKKLENIKNRKNPDKAIMEKTAKKIAAYYSPPILSTTRYKKFYKTNQEFLDASLDGALNETIVNDIQLQKKADLFWEINCTSKQYRIIEIQLYGSKTKSIGKKLNEDWLNIAPDSNTESWHELFCKI